MASLPSSHLLFPLTLLQLTLLTPDVPETFSPSPGGFRGFAEKHGLIYDSQFMVMTRSALADVVRSLKICIRVLPQDLVLSLLVHTGLFNAHRHKRFVTAMSEGSQAGDAALQQLVSSSIAEVRNCEVVRICS